MAKDYAKNARWDGLVRVSIVNNSMEAEMRMALLQEAGIDCALRNQSSFLGAAGILSGGWFTPQGIYVREEERARAEELLAACFPEED